MAAAESKGKPKDQPPKFIIPAGFTAKDYLIMLIHIDAEIEHGLMLQYLYSAYSIASPQVPETYQKQVLNWQKIILGIAKEEMGHFVSVQNVLKLMGAPLNFGRESYPWDIPFYPFPFTLEKFSLDSLAKYIYAEAPSEWLKSSDPLAAEIVKRVDAEVSDPHTVGALFQVILQIMQDDKLIPDDVFQAGTYPYQAKFDEWGRGYTGGERGSDGSGRFTESPDVLVAPLLGRDDAVAALKEIAEQGEGVDIREEEEPSHFERFLFIYKEYKKILESDKNFEPARNVATNPYVSTSGYTAPETSDDDPSAATEGDPITNPDAVQWANLFDLRYRMLLNYLNHSFLLDNGYNNAGSFAPRGLIINSTFGEMYNLRSIATVLVQTPASHLKSNKKMAGPPFTLPYTMDLPFGEHNRWRLHQDLLEAAGKIIAGLKASGNQQHLGYLNALAATDAKMLDTIAKLADTIPA